MLRKRRDVSFQAMINEQSSSTASINPQIRSLRLATAASAPITTRVRVPRICFIRSRYNMNWDACRWIMSSGDVSLLGNTVELSSKQGFLEYNEKIDNVYKELLYQNSNFMNKHLILSITCPEQPLVYNGQNDHVAIVGRYVQV